MQLDQRRVIPGPFPAELIARNRDAQELRELRARQPDSATVFVVGRFMTLRLLATDHSLRHTERAWSPWYDPGISLTAPGGRVAYADKLTDEQQLELMAQGWRIEKLNYREN